MAFDKESRNLPAKAVAACGRRLVDNLKLALVPACRDVRCADRDDTVEITVFNRGITLFMSDDEKVRRINWVLCKLDGSGKSDGRLNGKHGEGNMVRVRCRRPAPHSANAVFR